ncbi:mucin-2-like isoform X8 [Cydia strobilella]|uniref:mucin-2-like isoform X8 n=1 Tax=Cydia strobilella TaxID=1100964 RepID=UPI003005B785
MRAGVWCVALALLAVGGALRPTQAEGTTRVGRRLSIHTSTESSALGQEHASTPRRGSRRREETSPRQAVRRTRTRAPQIEEVTEPETKRNTTDESFDSRKAYSRTRNRPEPEEDTPKANVIRSRTRFNRPAPTQPTPTTKAPEVTSPIIDESKIEVINSTLEEITKMVFKEYEPVTQSNRRSSTRTIANVTQRRRSRVNVRTNEQSDLTSSGTTNSISISEKGPTTDKMIDLRGSRKLRYKQRQSDTDTNLTGLGITASNEVQQSSQKEIPSQETKLSAPVENVQQSTETNPLKTTTLKVMRIVRRPVQRGKGSFKPNASLSLAKKRSDEVSEDDNYPEPFKALLQAKNASTQFTSPNDESLTLKASQKVYNSFAPSQQSTLSSLKNKYSRLRPKPNVEKELKNAIKPDDKPTESTVAPNTLTTKAPSYKFRSQQTTRSRKFSHLTSSTVSNTEQSSDKPPYKYNRKFKMSTTEAPKTELKINSKRVETNNLLKKTSHRPTFYSRRNSSKSDASTTTPSNDESLNIGSALESIAKHKATLSRTSYYSRQRNSKKVLTTSIPSTEEPFKDSNSVIETADRKNADNVDIPLIYTLLKPTDVSQNENNLDISQNENNSEKPHKMFVIAVTSNESPESSTENEMTSNTVEETEVRSVVGSSTSKYHATYTVPQTTSKVEERDVLSAVPPIRNIPTRKFGRGRVSSRSQNDGVSEEPVTRDRGAGKYTDSYTKTTEASTNGINPDTEKSRHRFSSKFRASHDKPIYRATVPTVTPSTIEGDEYQLGPDMNAITFTQTRSPAELLKLSESLVKPHVMNVETSQHSQSVTVSIFDALADILTSTPRNRLSSTTEVQKQNIKTDSIQSLNVISTSALNLKDSSRGVTTVASKPAEQSTASHVLSLRTTTMLPSVDEILLNSISSAAKEEMVISSMTSSTRQPTILTLDIDPETKQIRTEKPGEIKFISIDEVTTTTSPNTNVLKLASSKSPATTITSQMETSTESSTQTPQIPTQVQNDDRTTTGQVAAGTITDAVSESTTVQSVLTTSTTEASTTPIASTEPVTTTTMAPVTTTTETTTTTAKAIETTTEVRTTLRTTLRTTTVPPTTSAPTTAAETILPSTATSAPTEGVTKDDLKRYQEDAALLEAILSGAERLPKKLNFNTLDQNTGTSSFNTQTKLASATKQSDDDKFLQQLLSVAGKNPHTLTVPNIGGNIKVNGVQTTTARSIEDDIRQFEEDTKLLKALLAATGQDPAKFNIPTLDIKTTTLVPTTETTTTSKPTESTRAQTTTPSIDADITRFQEDAKLLQALLQATGQNNGNFKIPDITGVTSNVRIASNPLTTSLGSNPTTPINVRPIYTTLRTTTLPPTTVTVPTTFQPRATDSTTARISTTFPPFRRRPTATTVSTDPTTVATARRVPIPGFIVTTEIPTSSTFSVEEDLAFLNNLKSVLNTNTDSTDPEAALANRIIALAVDRSLNEIKSGQGTERMGKNLVPTTAPTTTTTTTTTTTPRPTSAAPSTPSIEDDLRQFQEDTKLLQALLKATGQDPSKLNLPTIPNINANVSPKIPPGVHSELNLLSNLLASPSPLNEPFDSLTQEPKEQIKTTITTTPKPFGAKIAVKDDVKNIQDDGKLLQTLINLQGVQETTTQKSKIAITGQSTDEALKKLIQQTKSPGMVQDATKMPIAISTEYGKSNDALLAALLKEQGFGPTTASSLDEQIRLAALLNQVVVTPKARRTTTPPPPPAPRRPILDGLAWLWQQWRETGPGTGAQQRPSRRPDPSPTAAVSASQATSNRVNWFGSGPFVGNADDKPNNRIPLDPPRAVTSEQTPGRGQLVSAAINVTRAFSQFLGAAIQGAAQTVQSVIRAGQRAATDVYSNGSGASG